MRRETLAAVTLGVVGLGLAAAQVVTLTAGSTTTVAIRSVPMVAVAAAVTFAGAWTGLRGTPETERVVGWTVGGGATVAAVFLLAVLGTGLSTDLSAYLVDGFTGGTLLGLLVGVYDVRSRERRSQVEAFAQSVAALNQYGKALNSSRTLDEISGLCVEAVEFLVSGDGAAFLLVDETDEVTVVDSTLRRDDELATLESLATAVDPDEDIEAVRYAEATVELAADSPDAALVIAVETARGRAMIVSMSTATGTEYDDEDVDLLETLAAHVSTALAGIETADAVGVGD
jgi:hypothetical protein